MLKKILQLSSSIVITYISLVQPIQGADIQGTVLKTGLINCYPEDVLDEDGKPLPASPSTVVFDGQKLIFANDKSPQDTFLSPVFTIDFPNLQTNLQKSPLYYLTYPPFKHIVKYESSTLTLNGKIVIMSGCFGLLPPFSSFSPSNCYRNHTIISFPVGHPEKASIVSPASIEGTACSLPVRKAIEKLLSTPQYPNGVPFINIEGMTCIPGNRLLFGVRQIGESWDKGKHMNTIMLLAVTYQIINEKVVLFNDFEILYQINPYALLKTPAPLSLSGLEYDKYNNRILFLTTYEMDDHGTNANIGTFLWTLPFDDLLTQKPPTLVKTPEGTPLFFPHKLEGLTFIAKDTLFLVADDDSILLYPDNTPYRQHNQAVYFIVKLSSESPTNLQSTEN